MPLEICKFGRAKRLRICREANGAGPDYGYCAVHKSYYFGYKIHAVCTPNGTIKTFDISSASKHDIHYLNDLKTQLDHCVLVGDKGYLSRRYPQGIKTRTTCSTPPPSGWKRPCAATKLTLSHLLIGCRNCVKLALKNGGVNPFFYANKKRPVMALSFVSKLSAL